MSISSHFLQPLGEDGHSLAGSVVTGEAPDVNVQDYGPLCHGRSATVRVRWLCTWPDRWPHTGNFPQLDMVLTKRLTPQGSMIRRASSRPADPSIGVLADIIHSTPSHATRYEDYCKRVIQGTCLADPLK
jgi:hypothetical protein